MKKKKLLKRLIASVLATSLVFSGNIIPVQQVGAAESKASGAQQDAISFPIKLIDYRADRLLFEYLYDAGLNFSLVDGNDNDLYLDKVPGSEVVTSYDENGNPLLSYYYQATSSSSEYEVHGSEVWTRSTPDHDYQTGLISTELGPNGLPIYKDEVIDAVANRVAAAMLTFASNPDNTRYNLNSFPFYKTLESQIVITAPISETDNVVTGTNNDWNTWTRTGTTSDSSNIPNWTTVTSVDGDMVVSYYCEENEQGFSGIRFDPGVIFVDCVSAVNEAILDGVQLPSQAEDSTALSRYNGAYVATPYVQGDEESHILEITYDGDKKVKVVFRVGEAPETQPAENTYKETIYPASAEWNPTCDDCGDEVAENQKTSYNTSGWIRQMNHTGAKFTVPNVDGGNGGEATIILHYDTANTTTVFTIDVNGVEQGQVALAGTGTYNGGFTGRASIVVTIPEGTDNTITVHGGNGGANVASVQVNTGSEEELAWTISDEGNVYTEGTIVGTLSKEFEVKPNLTYTITSYVTQENVADTANTAREAECDYEIRGIRADGTEGDVLASGSKIAYTTNASG